MKNPRVKSVSRKDVFELLISIQSKAGTALSGDIETRIGFLHEIDGMIDRFIFADDPFALTTEKAAA